MTNDPFLSVHDPNWSSDAGGGGKGANEHYDLMKSVEDYAWQVRMSPPWRDTGPGLMFMWATVLAFNTGDAVQLIHALGFRVASHFIWWKADVCKHCEGSGVMPVGTRKMVWTNCDKCGGTGGARPPRRMGIGQWGRMEHEILFVCRRGEVSLPAEDKRPRSVIIAPRAEHSAKPEEAWSQVIEPIASSSMPGVVGVEWNCRAQRRGWGAYGRLDGEGAPLRYAPAAT